MLIQAKHARRYALPLAVVGLLIIGFNNCGKRGSSTAASVAAGDTSAGGGTLPGVTPLPSPTPEPAPAPAPTPVPSPAPAAQPLAVTPATASAEPYQTVNFAISGGTAPYVISGDFNATIPQAAAAPLLGWLPRDYNATVTDAAGAKIAVKLSVSGTLAPAIAVATYRSDIGAWNYYYTTQLEQSNTFPKTDVSNGFPVYALKPISKLRAVYICDNGSGRQFLSNDLQCEGHPGLGFLGYLYDVPTAAPGFTLKPLIRIYNAQYQLHRVLTGDAALPAGFQPDGVTLGYLPPKVPPEWCNKWMSCN